MPTGRYNVVELSSASVSVAALSSSTTALGTVFPTAPAAANVLTGVATTTAGSMLTIPAGGTWQGCIALSFNSVNSSTSATATGTVTVVTSGQGVTPASSSVLLGMSIIAPVATSAAVTQASFGSNLIENVTVVAGTSAGLIQVAAAGAAVSSIYANANGQLL